jgi:amino acid adenylation domain-containing protein/thioester reductase-like protein
MEQLLIDLKNRGVGLWLDGDLLRVNAPRGTLTDELRAQIATHKAVLVGLLRARRAGEELPAITPDPRGRHEPFPLTDVQHAYWMGRKSVAELGGVSTHFYFELDCGAIDVPRLSDALRRVIARHEMLRAVIDADGLQRVLPAVPAFTIPHQDCSRLPGEEADRRIDALRAEMSHQVLPSDRWPLFDIRATSMPGGRTRLHCSLDMLILDAWSMFILFREWFQLYEDPGASLPPIDVTYRDYVLAERQIAGTPAHARATQYWMSRVDTLPPAPELPVRAPTPGERPRFSRRRARLDAARWERLKELARTHGITISSLLLAAYAEVVARWSATPHFTLNVTLFNRLPLHPHVDRLLGDFTSLVLLEVDHREGVTFLERARRLQRQLAQDLEHREVSGVEVLREWAHRREARMKASMPVVFTSALVLRGDDGEDAGLVERLGPMVYGVSQTPQVWLDNQAMDVDGELVFNWDAVDDVFEEGVLDAMFGAYLELLGRLADGPAAWHDEDAARLPAPMAALRAATNATAAPERDVLLHGDFVEQARARPDPAAVITPRRTLTYRQLLAEAAALARRLRERGVTRGDRVAIVMRKGWEQVVGAVGTLLAGAAYLPLDAGLPRRRRLELLSLGEVRHVVTQPGVVDDADRAALGPECSVLAVVPAAPCTGPVEVPAPSQARDDLAYVLFTSGTTGVPKGVMIDHRAAMNTVAHVNAMLGLSAADRVLGVSSLSFDLSVYDLFGPLGVGGALVLPDPDRHLDPAHWRELVAEHRVTVWNSAPQLMRMLLDGFAAGEVEEGAALRAALLSGDWIPVDVPARLAAHYPGARTTSLGGATEAAIWSNFFRVDEVDPAWPSIPYGKPLPNQTMWVLDRRMSPCPDHVPGKIYIGGIGLAQGYWRDAEKTAQRFVRHPVTGERLYDTGDLGRYLPDGNIQFLGRGDEQVKIRGHRVEPGEVASVLRQHPEVQEAAVLVTGAARDRRELVAYVELDARRVDQLGAVLVREEEAPPPLGERLADELRAPSGDPHTVLARVLARLLPGRGALDVLGIGDGVVAAAEHVVPVLAGTGGRLVATAPSQETLEQARAELLPFAGDVEVRLLDPEVRPDFQGHERHAHALVLAAGLRRAGDPGRLLEHARELLRPGGELVLLERVGDAEDPQVALGAALDREPGEDPLPLPERAWREALRRAGFVDVALCRPAADGGPAAAVIVATAPASVPVLDGRAVSRYLADRLPEYMVPKYVVQVARVPVSANGKIDYRALPPVPEDAALGQTERVEPRTDEERRILEVWARVMNRTDLGVTDNFFDLGGDSLVATRLVRELNAILPFALDLAEVVENPTIEGLATVWAARAAEGEDAAGRRREVSRAFPALLVDERRILTDVLEGTKRIEALPRAWLEEAPGKDAVLVTGATGWIGAYVVAELLATSDADVFCLVRADGEGEAHARLTDALRAYGLLRDAKASQRLKAVAGRLDRPRLGLEEASWRSLAASVSAVYHLGASISTVGDYEDLFALNVRPVEEVVRLALEGRRKAIFHGSSAAVNLRHGAEGFFVIPEEGMTSAPAGLLNGYAQTKWAAEQLVVAAARRGVPAKIFRISHALPADAGFVRPRPYMVEAVLAAARRVPAVPDWPGSAVYGVPVDRLARILVACARAGGRDDGVAEVVHVDNRTPLEVGALVRILHAADGVGDAPVVSREEWRDRCFAAARELPAEHAALATRLFEPTVAGALVEAMFGADRVESAFLDRLPGGALHAALTPTGYWERWARVVRDGGHVPGTGAAA